MAFFKSDVLDIEIGYYDVFKNKDDKTKYDVIPLEVDFNNKIAATLEHIEKNNNLYQIVEEVVVNPVKLGNLRNLDGKHLKHRAVVHGKVWSKDGHYIIWPIRYDDKQLIVFIPCKKIDEQTKIVDSNDISDANKVTQYDNSPNLIKSVKSGVINDVRNGGKRKSRRNRKSKKSRKGKSRKNRRKSNRRR